MNSFRRWGQGLFAGIVLAAFTQVNSFGQSMASASQPEALAAPSGLQTAVYQIPETTKFKVHFVNNSSHPVTIQLRDARNQVIYSEKISGKNYIRKFDLEQLGDGTYTFEINNGSQRIVKEVDLHTVRARSVQVQ